MDTEKAVASLTEYIIITGVIMALFVVMLLLVNTNIMENPADRLAYIAFTDIGNGISTRMVDVYAISPVDGTILTRFDIPDDIAGKDYVVEVGTRQNPVNFYMNDQYVHVSRNSLSTDVSLSGIGASRAAGGSTTGRGMNTICYNSSGTEEGVEC